MTIERPMFPPRAESVDSISPAQELLPSATVLKMRPRAINPPVKTTGAEGLSLWEAGSKREAASDVIKAAVTYCCSKSTAEAGFIADHTRDSVFAGCGGIVGEKYSRDAERSMRKLVKLMDGAKGLMTVELRSLASVAGFVIKQIEQLEVDPNDDEMDFLKSFAGLVERFCGDQYDREIKAERKPCARVSAVERIVERIMEKYGRLSPDQQRIVTEEVNRMLAEQAVEGPEGA